MADVATADEGNTGVSKNTGPVKSSSLPREKSHVGADAKNRSNGTWRNRLQRWGLCKCMHFMEVVLNCKATCLRVGILFFNRSYIKPSLILSEKTLLHSCKHGLPFGLLNVGRMACSLLQAHKMWRPFSQVFEECPSGSDTQAADASLCP